MHQILLMQGFKAYKSNCINPWIKASIINKVLGTLIDGVNWGAQIILIAVASNIYEKCGI